MVTSSSTPPAVKEFRFNSDSEIVTVVFADDQAQDFKGSDNYKKAHHAAIKAANAPTDALELEDDKGSTVIVSVPVGTPHETFED